jgi:DNA polymerase-3 subunit chi
MQQVDFYLIENEVSDAQHKLCCRLCQKLYSLEQKTVVICQSQTQADSLDKQMWGYEDSSFLPHGVVHRAHQVHQGSSKENQIDQIDIVAMQPDGQMMQDLTSLSNQYDVIVNLSDSQIDLTPSNEKIRIAEIVEKNDTAREQARVRYKYYQGSGYELKTHSLKI